MTTLGGRIPYKGRAIWYLEGRRVVFVCTVTGNAIVRTPALFTQFSQIGIAVIGRDFMVVLSQRAPVVLGNGARGDGLSDVRGHQSSDSVGLGLAGFSVAGFGCSFGVPCVRFVYR